MYESPIVSSMSIFRSKRTVKPAPEDILFSSKIVLVTISFYYFELATNKDQINFFNIREGENILMLHRH